MSGAPRYVTQITSHRIRVRYLKNRCRRCILRGIVADRSACIDGNMVRRSLILALALSVAGLGIVPDVLCGLVCARSAQMPCCRTLTSLIGLQKRGGESSGDSTANCRMACTFLRAPLQTSQHGEQGIVLLRAVANATVPLDTAPVNRAPHPQPSIQDTSPPPLQSLLCTFLI
jgi:hypothetical protein